MSLVKKKNSNFRDFSKEKPIFLIFYFYPISELNELLYILGFIGFANGATGVLFWSMLPDTIEYGEWRTGIRTESSLYGFMTFAQKGALYFRQLTQHGVIDYRTRV